MLQITNLDAGYGELQVLKGINIEVKEKEIVALIGPNGAGKSTVLKSIFSIAKINSGNIVFKGKDITKMRTHQLLKTGISYVPQGKINFSELTIEENLLIGAELLTEKTEIYERLEHVYSKFPVLLEKKDNLAYSLSGGQQQMLALGRALMQKPSLLLMDEPSLGLSPKLQKELFKLIQKLRDDGLSILVVEQNAKKAIEISDKTYLLEDGVVALTGGKEILKDSKIKNVYLGGHT